MMPYDMGKLSRVAFATLNIEVLIFMTLVVFLGCDCVCGSHKHLTSF